MALALARKYRPRKFADVAVQSHVANTLRNAIVGDRVAHAYLFCGPRGTGKTTLARVLAMALNCERRTADREPCGECPSCDRVWSGGASLDVVEIDAASNRGVDDARDLRERAMYAPSGDDRYKVYIIDEAHMLTREAWNALLKILEEPPPRVVFVFATTEPQKIQQAAAPVLSRVQRFDLKRIGPADVRARLATVLAAEKLSAEPDALAMLARAADGSMRDALSLTDQVLSLGEGAITADRVRDALGLVHEDEHLALLDLIIAGKAGEVFGAVGRLADHGVDFAVLLGDFADLLRAQLAVVLGGALPDTSDHLRTELPGARQALLGRRPAADARDDRGARAAHQAERPAADAVRDAAGALCAAGPHDLAGGGAARRRGVGRWVRRAPRPVAARARSGSPRRRGPRPAPSAPPRLAPSSPTRRRVRRRPPCRST